MTHDQTDRPGQPMIRTLVGAGAAIVTLALAWAQFRGLDLMDAATHFLIYQFPADNPDTHTRFELFARPLWLLVGGNVVAFRLLCLGLLSGAAWIFWRNWRAVVADPADPALTRLTLWLATMAGLAWLPVLLGYNSLSTFFALLALAALARALALDPRSTGRSWWLRPAWGAAFLILVALAGLAKPPAALALGVCGGFLSFNLLPLSRGWRLALIALAALGGVLAVLAVNRWFERTIDDPTALMQIAGVQFRPLWMLETLQRYGRELAVFLPALGRDLLFVAGPALALAVLAAFRGRNRSAAAAWPGVVSGALLATIIAAAGFRGLWDGSFANAVSGEMARLYLLLWIAVLPAWLVGWIRDPSAQTRPGLIAVAFFFLPPTCGFGSTNTLYFSALHWTVFWTAGLLVVSGSVAQTLGVSWFRRAFTGLLALVAAAHLFSGHFLHPYMHQPPLWRQTESVAVGSPSTTLRLDPATARFLTEVRGILDGHGYHPGDDVFGFFNLPGVIFALGAKQPGAPWYFGTWYGGDDTDGGKIRNVSPERRQHAWIITQADVTIFHREFKACGIDFPDGYEKIGETTNPMSGHVIGIWKPKARP